MAVYIRFELDTSTEVKTIELQSPYADKGQTRDNLDERIAENNKALMPLRDAGTGDYVFINTMKIANIAVYEKENEE